MSKLRWRPGWGMVFASACVCALWLAAVPAGAAGAADAASAPQDSAAKNRTQKQAEMQTGVALMVVPVAVATVDTMNNGCWARFYSEANLRGDVLALSGPVSMANMDRVQPFWGDADSVVIGPKARVTTYDNDNFRDQTAVLAANQRVDNLRERLRWHEGVESVRIECVG